MSHWGVDSAANLNRVEVVSDSLSHVLKQIRKEIAITPTETKQTFDFPDEIKTFEVNRNFYIETAKGQ